MTLQVRRHPHHVIHIYILDHIMLVLNSEMQDFASPQLAVILWNFEMCEM